MATTIQSTRLDFNNIKSRLKTYLAQQSEFTDYNFEGAGLSNILDVLSYNTHFNGLIANFALNEAFLKTAQLRSSVVSHASSLGYQITSKTAPLAYVNISVSLAGVPGRPTSITLLSGTKFTTSVNNITYTFQTLSTYSGTDDGNGLYQFLTDDGSSSIPIYEGTSKTKTFYVGASEEYQVFVIQDATIDTSTIVVDVYESPTSESYNNYLSLYDAIAVDATSQYFIIAEAPNGNYELVFSDGQSTGVAPVAGNKIVVSYLSTVGASANGAYIFTPVSTISVNNNNYSLSVTTVSVAAGGAEKESIESIRLNAPLAFASQQRLVTAEDYESVIASRFPSVIDVKAWGGQDNDPVVYGKTYVALRFSAGVSESQKTTIKNAIRNNITSRLGMMSIDTVFVDPITTYLEIQAFFNFDPALTGTTIGTTENNVILEIQDYFDNTLADFGTVFRKSILLENIQNLSEAILNARMNVKLQQRITPLIRSTAQSFTVNFPEELSNPSATTQIITSSNFNYNNKVCRLVNVLSSTKLQVIDGDGNVLIDNAGSYNASLGKVSISGLIVEGVITGSTIKISAVPANDSTIRPLRNYILEFDASGSFASGIIDNQTVEATLE